jgi:NAD(P)-dependent dehydrogenase (short-subunit alcohol dehydrogenase family)
LNNSLILKNHKITDMSITMQNKVCLVTGATSGIGFVTALELAKMGATVVVGGRDMEKSANTVIKIRSESNNQNVDFLLANLSDFEEVRTFAVEFKAQYKRLDVLVNNAGAVFKEYDENSDRLEMTMALNFFSPFLLTGLLLDTLKGSAPSRIINVSSMMHQMAKNNFNNFNNEANYKAFNAYSLSKLALMHFTYELDRKLKGSGVMVNAMHPGWVKSNFGSDVYTGFYGVVDTLSKPLQLTPEQGANTIIYLASSDEVENVSGKYFVKKKAVNSSAASYDKQVSADLWEMAENKCKMKYDISNPVLSEKVDEVQKQQTEKGPSEDKPKDN